MTRPRKRPVVVKVTESDRSIERLARVLAFNDLDWDAQVRARNRARAILRSLKEVESW